MLTAKHVVTGQETVFVVVTAGKTLEVIESERIITHPEADVAAITIPRMTREATECYQLRTPPTGYKEFPIGEEVAAYGYPKMGCEKPVSPRLMRGHIQRQFEHRDKTDKYAAFEPSFPAFPGLSGSPIFLDEARNHAIGIVTKSISFTCEEHGTTISAAWAIGASLTPLRGWIEGLFSQRQIAHEDRLARDGGR